VRIQSPQDTCPLTSDTTLHHISLCTVLHSPHLTFFHNPQLPLPNKQNPKAYKVQVLLGGAQCTRLAPRPPTSNSSFAAAAAVAPLQLRISFHTIQFSRPTSRKTTALCCFPSPHHYSPPMKGLTMQRNFRGVISQDAKPSTHGPLQTARDSLAHMSDGSSAQNPNTASCQCTSRLTEPPLVGQALASKGSAITSATSSSATLTKNEEFSWQWAGKVRSSEPPRKSRVRCLRPL